MTGPGHVLAYLHNDICQPPLPMSPSGRDAAPIHLHTKDATGPLDIFLREHKASEIDLEGGKSALCFMQGPFVHHHVDPSGSCHVVFKGECGHWGTLDLPALNETSFVRGEPGYSEASMLHALYTSFVDTVDVEDVVESALTALSKMQGSFAFILYDRDRKRVLIGRSPDGAEELYWGQQGDHLVVSSEPAALKAAEPAATPFPAGTMFCSMGNLLLASSPGVSGWTIAGPANTPGRLFSFVHSGKVGKEWRDIRQVPMMGEDAVIHGVVFKVESESNLARNG